MEYNIIPREFYNRSPDVVACELLGKKLFRVVDESKLVGIIVETEAYFGETDPASRAFKGLKKFNSLMWDNPGQIFVYNVHKYWMLNVIAHEVDCVGGVLFRSIEPTKGIDYMKKNRSTSNIFELTNGPGKLSISFKISRDLNGFYVSNWDSPLMIFDAPVITNYSRSYRIGVSKDLPEKLRFFIKDNKFVSKK